MIVIDGGTFTMGSDRHYPEERPAHDVTVSAFEIAEAPVTVAQFALFVDATGYVTSAELPPDGYDTAPGSAVFTPTSGPVDLSDTRNWWRWEPGASWRDGAADHPVVHVSLADALAYCAWAEVRLPTETEWEWAAQGSVRGNTWEGAFPYECRGLGTTSAVGSYAPNPWGLVDALGNVWEWTGTPWAPSHEATCCSPPTEGHRQVAKGGSFLCAPDYCARYRPQARMAMAVDSPTCHLGFRVAR